MDAVYDGIEFCMLLPSVFLIPLLYQPSNEKYPFGHMQLETVFVVIKGITMSRGNHRHDFQQYQHIVAWRASGGIWRVSLV